MKMKNSIIICTSNYMSEKEIKSALGEPIYSRFDAVIKFDKLDKAAIEIILNNEYDRQYQALDDILHFPSSLSRYCHKTAIHTVYYTVLLLHYIGLKGFQRIILLFRKVLLRVL